MLFNLWHSSRKFYHLTTLTAYSVSYHQRLAPELGLDILTYLKLTVELGV
jgi:hypothetical protein